MALSKNTVKWLFIVAIAIVVITIVVYIFRCNIFSGLSSCVEDPNKTNTPVPPASPTSKWVTESFPLNVGMYGPKIKALQSKLGITADGKFGPQTNSAILAKGYKVPLSQADYDKIVGTTSGSGSGTGSTKTLKDYEGTFIKTGTVSGTTVRYIADSSAFKVFGPGENIGTLGADLGNGYHRIFDVAGYNDSLGSGLKIADAQLKVILGIK